MKNQIKILHISPHLGGGVGRVLLNFFIYAKNDEKYRHSIYCLDYINDKGKTTLNGLCMRHKELMHKEHKELLEEIKKVDIIIVHWWNHPLLYEFLIKNTLPPSRVAFWSHTSGAYPPQVFSKKLLDYPDIFVFTTPMSYFAKEVTEFENSSKLHHIWSSGGILHVKGIKRKKHTTFNLGYIGSIDFAKMHPDFVEICSCINIPEVRFIICGDGCDLDTIKQQVKQKGLEEKFKFMGYVQDIREPLSLFDLFFYPLNPFHYGTCDQVIAEAMTAGVVPMVFGNPMESYMVHHLYNGMVAQNKEEFIKNIEILYENNNFVQMMGKNAKLEAQRRFQVKNTVKEWCKVYKKLLSFNKNKKHWNGKYSGNYVKQYQIFLESLGESAKVFTKCDDYNVMLLAKQNRFWHSASNGTVHQYQRFFKDDQKLKYWSNLMKKQIYK